MAHEEENDAKEEDEEEKAGRGENGGETEDEVVAP